MGEVAATNEEAFEAAKLDIPPDVSFVVVGVKGGQYIRKPVQGDAETARLSLAMYRDANPSVSWRILRATRTTVEDWFA